MDAVVACLSLPARIGDGFAKANSDAVSYLAHLFVLP